MAVSLGVARSGVRLVALSAMLMLAAGGEAAARSHAVRVPAVQGSLSRAYTRLHAAGLLVTIPRRFTWSSLKAVEVKRADPVPGTRVKRGSVVRLAISCCVGVRRQPKRTVAAALVPNLLGYRMSTAEGWARQRRQQFVAALGPLHAGAAPQLTENYRIVSQSPAAGRSLSSGGTLRVRAVQGKPRACTLPLFATVVVRDARAVVSSLRVPGFPEDGTNYYGCVYTIGRQLPLINAYFSNDSDLSVIDPVLSGTHLAIQVLTDGGKYGSGPENRAVDVIDLMDGKPRKVFDAGTRVIDQLTVNGRGFAAWHVVDSPLITSQPLGDVSCPSPSLCVAVDVRGTVFTSTDPTGGRSAWTPAALPTTGRTAGVSCPSANLCVIVAGAQILTSTDPTAGSAAWTATAIPGAQAPGQALFNVTCLSASLCVAVGGSGIAASTNPTGGAAAWSYGSVAGNHDLFGVSCPSTALCVASDFNGGNMLSSTDPAGGASTWMSAAVDPTGRNISDVSCPSTTLCLADDASGNILTSTNPTGGVGAWTVTNISGGFLTGLSCPSASLCVAGSLNGVAASTDPAGGPGAWSLAQIPGGAGMQGVSCPATSLCVAVNTTGYITTSAHPTGGAGAWSASQVDSLPCTVTGGCATEQIYAYDDQGTRPVDSAPEGSGQQLADLALSGDRLTWTRDGTPMQATLS